MTVAVASTTAGRLMCASAATYQIGIEDCAKPPVDGIFLGGSGLQDAIPFCSTDHTNACLVGTNHDGVVIAFRGTLPPKITDPTSIKDWIENDFDVPMTAAPELGAGVEVHAGWWRDLATIWPAALAHARSLLDSTPSAALHVTGHSKGGPLAAMAAASATVLDGLSPRVTTFASPNPGNAAFAALFAGSGGGSGISSTNYENYGDVIPLLPPTLGASLALDAEFVAKITELTVAERIALSAALTATSRLGYEPVGGDVLFIALDGTVAPVPDDVDRAADVGAAFEEGGIGRVLASHCHACFAERDGKVTCAGGYMMGTTQDEICGG